MLIESLHDPYGALAATLCRTLNEPQINAKENYRPAGLRSAVLYFAARRESCEGDVKHSNDGDYPKIPRGSCCKGSQAF